MMTKIEKANQAERTKLMKQAQVLVDRINVLRDKVGMRNVRTYIGNISVTGR